MESSRPCQLPSSIPKFAIPKSLRIRTQHCVDGLSINFLALSCPRARRLLDNLTDLEGSTVGITHDAEPRLGRGILMTSACDDDAAVVVGRRSSIVGASRRQDRTTQPRNPHGPDGALIREFCSKLVSVELPLYAALGVPLAMRKLSAELLK